LIDISSREELVRALKANEVVFIEYYDSSSENKDLSYYIMRELTKYIDPRILVLRIDVYKYPDLGGDVSHTPCLRVFYRGKMVFEQQGFFGDIELDMYVLRRSIRSVFHGLNIGFRV